MKFKPSRQLENQVSDFIEATALQTFSNRWRQIFLLYVQYELRAGLYPLWLPEFISSMEVFFELLDTAVSEIQQPPVLMPKKKGKAPVSSLSAQLIIIIKPEKSKFV